MTRLDKIYTYFTQHWFISVLLITVPNYWFILIQVAGKNLKLIENDGKLTSTALYGFWLLFFISFVFAMFKIFYDYRKDKHTKSSQEILQDILSSVNSVTNRKASRFNSFIKSNKQSKSPFAQITKPKEQIKDLSEELIICLSKALQIKREDIGVSIIYKYKFNDNYDWFFRKNVSAGLELKEILNNENSTARQIIDGKHSSIFIGDKKQGIFQGQYVADKKDKSHDTIGSIICRSIDVEINDEIYVKAILNVTTYGKQICEEEDVNTKTKLLNIILPPFEIRMKLELALAYIKDQCLKPSKSAS